MTWLSSSGASLFEERKKEIQNFKNVNPARGRVSWEKMYEFSISSEGGWRQFRGQVFFPPQKKMCKLPLPRPVSKTLNKSLTTRVN